MRDFTYGLEIEISDADTRKTLPKGVSWNNKEDTVVNSSGIGCDPERKDHFFGGELNTAPTDSIQGQVDIFKQVVLNFPEATQNYRSSLHVHVSYPKIRESLEDLQKILKYSYDNHSEVIKRVYNPQIESRMPSSYSALRRSSSSCIPEYKLKLALEAKTIDEFKKAFATDTRGNYNPRLIRRHYCNLYHVFETDTIEFRCFFPTLDPRRVEDALIFCKRFILNALAENGEPVSDIIDDLQFQKESPFDINLEVSFRRNNYSYKLYPDRVYTEESNQEILKNYYKSSGKSLF